MTGLLHPRYRLPPGYACEDLGQEGIRTAWTDEPVPVKPSVWKTSNFMKYSSNEMLARGDLGEKISQGKGGHTSATAITRALRQLGVNGRSMFADLSYFKCAFVSCQRLCWRPGGPLCCQHLPTIRTYEDMNRMSHVLAPHTGLCGQHTTSSTAGIVVQSGPFLPVWDSPHSHPGPSQRLLGTVASYQCSEAVS